MPHVLPVSQIQLVLCQIWNHPDVLYEAIQKEILASEQDLDLDDITSSRCQVTANQKHKSLETPNPIGGLSLNQLQEKASQVITYEWVRVSPQQCFESALVWT